jgi:hypothetical protein
LMSWGCRSMNMSGVRVGGEGIWDLGEPGRQLLPSSRTIKIGRHPLVGVARLVLVHVIDHVAMPLQYCAAIEFALCCIHGLSVSRWGRRDERAIDDRKIFPEDLEAFDLHAQPCYPVVHALECLRESSPEEGALPCKHHSSSFRSRSRCQLQPAVPPL